MQQLQDIVGLGYYRVLGEGKEKKDTTKKDILRSYFERFNSLFQKKNLI